MNNIQVFNNSEFGDIRTVEIDGEVWMIWQPGMITLKKSKSS